MGSWRLLFPRLSALTTVPPRLLLRPSPNLDSSFYWFIGYPSFQIQFPGTSLWKPCLVTSPIPTQFCSCSVTSDRNTSSVIIVLTMSFLVFVFLEYTDILRGRNLWWVLPMCKEARYDFFIGNCCLTSEFCPTSCERGEAQGGWVIPSSLGWVTSKQTKTQFSCLSFQNFF